MLNVVMLGVNVNVTNKPFVLCIVMLSVVRLNVVMLGVNVTNKPFVLCIVMLSVVRLNVVMLSRVVAPAAIRKSKSRCYKTFFLSRS